MFNVAILPYKPTEISAKFRCSLVVKECVNGDSRMCNLSLSTCSSRTAGLVAAKSTSHAACNIAGMIKVHEGSFARQDSTCTEGKGISKEILAELRFSPANKSLFLSEGEKENVTCGGDLTSNQCEN